MDHPIVSRDERLEAHTAPLARSAPRASARRSRSACLMARDGTISALLEAAVARGEIAGAVALVARRETVDVHLAGFQDLAERKPMRRDTIFRILSMTKPLLAAAAMMLVQDGRLGLDAPVDPWLPELADRRVLRDIAGPLDETVPAARAITLRDLLTMRMGLGMIMAPPGTYPIQEAIAARGLAPGPDPLGLTPDEYMARLGGLPLAHQPGEGWLYHIGAEVTSVLIARVAGVPLGQFLEERLLGPLGMRDTGFHVPVKKCGRFATGYALDANGTTLVAHDLPRGGAYAKPPAFQSELVSTADDYLAFARLLAAKGVGPHGRLLVEPTVAAMMRDHVSPVLKAAWPFAPGFWDDNGWGLGGAVVTREGPSGFPPGSYGWMGGYGTSFVMDPARGRVAILLTQRLMRAPDDAALAIAFQAIASSLEETR